MRTLDKFGTTSTLYTKRRKTKREGEGPSARICKPFKEPRNRFQAWRARTTTLFIVHARQATKVRGMDSSESIPGLHKRLQIRALLADC
jgi:hypothetical protein